MKECNRCKSLKDLSDFVVAKDSKNGYKGYCKQCQNDRQRSLYKASPDKRKKQVYRAVKARKKRLCEEVDKIKSIPCTDCKQIYPPYVMDFDHRDSKQKIGGLSKMARQGISKEKILLEITKCDVVCSNCHRIRTHNRRIAQLVGALA